MSLPQRLVILSEGNFYRATFENLGRQDELIGLAAKNAQSIVSKLFDKNTHLYQHAPGQYYIASKLDHLNLHCAWREHKRGDVIGIAPLYRNSRDGQLVLNMAWTPPKDMALWFVMFADTTVEGAVKGSQNCYIVAQNKDNKRTYLLPLTNLYSDGRICMGDHFYSHPFLASGAGSIKELFEFGIGVFNTTMWNGHLEKDGVQEKAAEMFFFDADKKQQGSGSWFNYCTQIAHANYEFLERL
jgi:hypothetical protein